MGFGPPVEKHCEYVNMLTDIGLLSASFFVFNVYVCMYARINLRINKNIYMYSDTSANEDNSFRNHIR